MIHAESLDGRDLLPLRERGEQDAHRDRLAVYQRRTRSANPNAAGVTDARQVELASENVEKHLVRPGFDLDGLSIYVESNLHPTSSATVTQTESSSRPASAVEQPVERDS